MLSKLHFYENGYANSNESKAEVNTSALLSALAIDNYTLEQEGTLGVVVAFEQKGRPKIMKTHLINAECKNNLSKEADILSFLYGELIHTETLRLNITGKKQIILLMDLLTTPQKDPNLSEILKIIESYECKLLTIPHLKTMNNTYTFEYLLQRGLEAQQLLEKQNFLSQEVCCRLKYYLELLQKNIRTFPRLICHGDLSSKNILCCGDVPIVIDWEDAFWGIEGYDYLYWLTFFNHRKYYNRQIFGKTPYDRTTDIAIMLLIVLLKSLLAVSAKTYLKNQMSFNERIMEIMALQDI